MDSKGHRKMCTTHDTFTEEYARYYSSPDSPPPLSTPAHPPLDCDLTEAPDDAVELEAIREQLHSLTTDAADAATEEGSVRRDDGGCERAAPGGEGEGGGEKKVQDGGLAERVRAMLSARARRGIYIHVYICIHICMRVHTYMDIYI